MKSILLCKDEIPCALPSIYLFIYFLIFHGRNPLYLGFIFVAFLLMKALWVQLDISGEFQHGAVSHLYTMDLIGSKLDRIQSFSLAFTSYLLKIVNEFNALIVVKYLQA